MIDWGRSESQRMTVINQSMEKSTEKCKDLAMVILLKGLDAVVPWYWRSPYLSSESSYM